MKKKVLENFKNSLIKWLREESNATFSFLDKNEYVADNNVVVIKCENFTKNTVDVIEVTLENETDWDDKNSYIPLWFNWVIIQGVNTIYIVLTFSPEYFDIPNYEV